MSFAVYCLHLLFGDTDMLLCDTKAFFCDIDTQDILLFIQDTSVLSSDNDTSIVTQLNSVSPVTLTSCDGQDMGKLTKTLQQHIRDQGGSQH